MPRAPVFGDPAKDLQQRIQTAMNQPGWQSLPAVSHPSDVQIRLPPMEMTAQRIAQQNAVIQRLEGDWEKAKSNKAEQTRIANVIRAHLRDFPGTSSKLVKGGRRRKTRGRKSRRITRRR